MCFQRTTTIIRVNPSKNNSIESMNIKTSIVILIPGHNVNMDIESDTLVAETVIVGAVPEFFANLDGAELASAFSK